MQYKLKSIGILFLSFNQDYFLLLCLPIMLIKNIIANVEIPFVFLMAFEF